MMDMEYKKIAPAFLDKEAVAVVFATDNQYAMFLEVVLYSLIANSTTKNNYDINILGFHLSNETINKLQSLAMTSNVSIRVFDGNELIEVSGIKNISAGHVSFVSLFRLYISSLFKDYEKIIYLDIDLCIKADIAQLYNTDLEGKPIGAVLDETILATTKQREHDNKSTYLAKILKLNPPYNYFNAGVILIDLKKFYEVVHPTGDINQNILIDELFTHDYDYIDQDVLNVIFNDKVKLIDPSWNFESTIAGSSLDNPFISDDAKKFIQNPNIIKIIHYITRRKPWVMCYNKFDAYWWNVAKNVPSYNEIEAFFSANAKILEQDYTIKFKLKILYRFYSMLSALTIGKSRKRFHNLKRKYKNRIKDADLFHGFKK